MKAPRAIALCQCFNGALEFQAGNWNEAGAALRESINLYREIRAASGEALACQRLGVLQTARGELDAGLATLEEGIVAAERAPMRAHCLARLHAAIARNRLVAGDLAAAEKALQAGLEMSRRHGHCATCDALLLPVAISVRIKQGDLQAAEDFSRQLEEASVRYASRIWLAIALQARAELATAQAKPDQALGWYQEAYENFTLAGNNYEAARCLTASAAIRLNRRAPEDAEMARRTQLEAEGIFERLGVIKVMG